MVSILLRRGSSRTERLSISISLWCIRCYDILRGWNQEPVVNKKVYATKFNHHPHRSPYTVIVPSPQCRHFHVLHTSRLRETRLRISNHMFPTRMGARAGVQHRPTCSAAATTGTCFHGALPRCSPLCLHSQLGTRLPTYRGTARCMRLIAHVRNEPDQPSGQEAAPADRQAGRDTSSASPSSSGISPGPSSAPAPSPSSVTSASAAASDAQQQQPQQAPPEEVGPSGSAAPAASDTAAAPQQQGSSGSSPGRKRSRAGIKAQEILHHLQERPLPQISPALGAFLIAGAFCTAMVYVWCVFKAAVCLLGVFLGAWASPCVHVVFVETMVCQHGLVSCGTFSCRALSTHICAHHVYLCVGSVCACACACVCPCVCPCICVPMHVHACLCTTPPRMCDLCCFILVLV